MDQSLESISKKASVINVSDFFTQHSKLITVFNGGEAGI